MAESYPSHEGKSDDVEIGSISGRKKECFCARTSGAVSDGSLWGSKARQLWAIDVYGLVAEEGTSF